MNHNTDSTESIRQSMTAEINAEQAAREILEDKYGRVWDTREMTESFSVQGFMAPFVVVRRLSDGVRGTLMFQHSPRFYFSFEEES